MPDPDHALTPAADPPTRERPSGPNASGRARKPVRAPASLLVRVLRSAALAYIGLLGVLTIFQRHYIYYPAREPEADLLADAARQGLHPWRDADGARIGWRTQPSGAPGTAVLLFHGNAGHALHRTYFASALAASGPGPARETYILEYPGYGSRHGRPSEQSLVAAAHAAFGLLCDSGAPRLFLIGESLGAGVACALAAAHPDQVAGLLLITPFSSLADVARHHYPVLPVRRLLRDRYDNEAALRHYRGPVVIVVADRDTVVPAALGRRLHDGYAGPKQLRADAGATHNELWISGSAPWWVESWAFLDTHGARHDGDDE